MQLFKSFLIISEYQWLTMARFVRFDDRGKVPLMQRECIGFGFFAQTGPNDRPALLVNFHHVFARGCLVKAEDFAKDHHDV